MTTPARVEYADLVESVTSLVADADPTRRNMHWVRDGAVGLARTLNGGVELYVQVGKVHNSVVARNSRAQPVYRSKGSDPSEMLCISLPAFIHFDQFAAFICSELERVDVEGDLETAFREVEPLLELAFASTSQARLH